MRFLKKYHYGTRVYQNTEWYEYVVKPRDTRDDDTTWYFTDGEQYKQSEN